MFCTETAEYIICVEYVMNSVLNIYHDLICYARYIQYVYIYMFSIILNILCRYGLNINNIHT